ncbi:hypothetical protein [Kocuria sp. CPCC 205263]|uniref:hypothetical protein n=1 Tax=Kocuria sp. CPCC 205263 TaxID=3073555 RepID=UPI0034D44EDE
MSEPTAPAPDGPAPRVETVPAPTLARVVVRAMPAAAVLAIAMPAALWWSSTTPAVLDTPWWVALLIGLVVLFHVLAPLARAPRPGLLQVPAQQLRSALVSASGDGAVPTDPQVRTAAGVTACQRVEAAVYAVAATVGMALAWLLVAEPSWVWWILGLAGLAVISLLRARHCWAYLRVLRCADRTG